MKASQELDLFKLRDLCETFLNNFSKKNAFQIFEISRKHKLKASYWSLLTYIENNLQQCLSSNRFLSISYETLVDFLNKISIKQEDESFLLNRLLQWIMINKKMIKENSNQIENLINIIRYKQIVMNKTRYHTLENNHR